MIRLGEQGVSRFGRAIWEIVALAWLGVFAAAPNCPCVGSAHRSGVSLEELFLQAQAASSRSDYAQAEKLYRQILSVDPGMVPARVNLGLACYWQDKKREAVSEFEKALRVTPKEYSALLFSGLAYLDLGEYDRAHRALKEAARAKDMDPLLFWALGSLAMIHGETNSAVVFLERAVALDPRNARAIWLLGQAYARFAYRKEIAKVPADYSSLVEKSLRAVEELQPGSALLHVFKGDVLAARKLGSEALTEYRKALAIDPHWRDIHLLIGSLLGQLGRRDEALAELKQQLQDFPQDPRALLEVGVVQCRAGNCAAAVPYLQRALARDEENYEAHFRLGEAYVNLSKYALALPQLERAARLNPEKAEAYYLLSRAYRALSQNEKAAWALAQFNQRKATNP